MRREAGERIAAAPSDSRCSSECGGARASCTCPSGRWMVNIPARQSIDGLKCVSQGIPRIASCPFRSSTQNSASKLRSPVAPMPRRVQVAFAVPDAVFMVPSASLTALADGFSSMPARAATDESRNKAVAPLSTRDRTGVERGPMVPESLVTAVDADSDEESVSAPASSGAASSAGRRSESKVAR